MKVNRKQFKLHRLRGAGMRRLAGSKYIISKKKVVGDREVEFIIAPPPVSWNLRKLSAFSDWSTHSLVNHVALGNRVVHCA